MCNSIRILPTKLSVSSGHMRIVLKAAPCRLLRFPKHTGIGLPASLRPVHPFHFVACSICAFLQAP